MVWPPEISPQNKWSNIAITNGISSNYYPMNKIPNPEVHSFRRQAIQAKLRCFLPFRWFSPFNSFMKLRYMMRVSFFSLSHHHEHVKRGRLGRNKYIIGRHMLLDCMSSPGGQMSASKLLSKCLPSWRCKTCIKVVRFIQRLGPFIYS